MDFIRSEFYPKDSKDIIKYQYKTQKGDLYIIAQGKYVAKLYCEGKLIKESEKMIELLKLVPEGK